VEEENKESREATVNYSGKISVIPRCQMTVISPLYRNIPSQSRVEKSSDINCISVFPAFLFIIISAVQSYSASVQRGNISLTHYTRSYISGRCPPLYIVAASAPGINHFPASLLHEMKEFIMVTVGRCEAFIDLSEID